jgi:hypothetical protein
VVINSPRIDRRFGIGSITIAIGSWNFNMTRRSETPEKSISQMCREGEKLATGMPAAARQSRLHFCNQISALAFLIALLDLKTDVLKEKPIEILKLVTIDFLTLSNFDSFECVSVFT